jgi:hypothetical protein
MIEPSCTELKFMADNTIGTINTGKPYQAKIVVENARQEGLAKIELAIAEQKITRWLWLKAGEKKAVVFNGLTAPDAGTYQVRCGDIARNLQVEP